MKTIIFLFLINFVSLFWDKFNAIHTSNKLREEALENFQNNNYSDASRSLEELVYARKEEDGFLKLNLALCYEKMHRYSEAKALFQTLSSSSDMKIRSQAYLHLGVMLASAKKENALQYFRQALKADPANEEARFNYELLRKMNPSPLPESQKKEIDSGENSQQMTTQDQSRQKESEDREQNSDANTQQEQSSDMQLNDAGKNTGDALQSERLHSMNLTERQARQLLESLKNNEIQHVQQLKRPAKGQGAEYKGPEY